MQPYYWEILGKKMLMNIRGENAYEAGAEHCYLNEFKKMISSEYSGHICIIHIYFELLRLRIGTYFIHLLSEFIVCNVK